MSLKARADPILINPLPEISLDQIVAGRESAFFTSVKGAAYIKADIEVMLQILRLDAPKSVVEIGTGSGWITLNMAINAPDAIIHTWPFAAKPSAYKESAFSARIKEHHGVTLSTKMGFAAPAFCFINELSPIAVREFSQRCICLPSRPLTIIWNHVSYRNPRLTKVLGSVSTDIKQIIGTNLGYWRTE